VFLIVKKKDRKTHWWDPIRCAPRAGRPHSLGSRGRLFRLIRAKRDSISLYFRLFWRDTLGCALPSSTDRPFDYAALPCLDRQAGGLTRMIGGGNGSQGFGSGKGKWGQGNTFFHSQLLNLKVEKCILLVAFVYKILSECI
jgi:hypothetical protein